MSYELNPIQDTDAVFNGDITQNGRYLGRLYVFPTTNSNLIAMEIEQEWFLAHAEGEFVISGHVNTSGQWSVSPYQSLQPSKEYTSQSAIFNRVFSPEYLQDVLASRNIEQPLAPKDAVFVTNGDGNSDGDSGVGQPTFVDNQLTSNWYVSIPKLDVLRELLARETEQKQEALFDEVNDELDEVKLDALEELEAETAVIMPLHQQHAELLDKEDEEAQRLAIQDALIEEVLQEYLRQGTAEFGLPPFGRVRVQTSEEYFVLEEDTDSHKILAATLEGEVLDEISTADAAKFMQILEQVEVETWLTNAADLSGDDLNTDSERIEMSNQQTVYSRSASFSSGVEYGS